MSSDSLVCTLVKTKTAFDIQNDGIRLLTWPERVWHYRDKSYHLERYARINAWIFTMLEAANSPLALKAANKWIWYVEGNFPDATKSKSFEKLNLLVLSKKLNLELKNLEENPEFAKFAGINPLDIRLKFYNHTLRVDEKGKICILYQKEYRAWLEIKDKIPVNEIGKMTSHQYSENGFVEGSWRNPSSIKPNLHMQSSAWSNRFLYELVAYHNSKKHITMNAHFAVVLKSNQGELYSFGTGITKGDATFSNLFFARIAEFGSPDPMHIFGEVEGNTYKLAVEVNQETFNKLLQKVDELRKKVITKEFGFTLPSNNCGWMWKELNQIAGIDIPLEMTPERYFLEMARKKSAPYLPTLIKYPLSLAGMLASHALRGALAITPTFAIKIALFARVLFANWLAIRLRGLEKNEKILGERKSALIPPSCKFIHNPIKYIYELNHFNPNTGMGVRHPWIFVTEILPEIEKWRKEDPGNRKYQVPEKYKLKTITQ